MTYAIEMYFDKETEGIIMRLAHKIADAGLSTKYLEWKTKPHVTLAVYNDIDADRCAQLLERFAKERKAFPAIFDSVGMFNDTKTVFLSPTITRGLYDLHSELHVLMKEFEASAWKWYKPDCWVPHCTVLVLHEFKKLEGVYTSVGLVKITFPVEELKTFDFGQEQSR